MKLSRTSIQGFTLLELMITLAIIGILAAIAIPAYQNYTRRTYYNEILQTTTTYKIAVEKCVQKTGKLTQCDAGRNGIPAAILLPKGAVGSLTVADGVIVATPVPAKGVTGADNYVLTPTMDSGRNLTWKSSGGAVKAAYAE